MRNGPNSRLRGASWRETRPSDGGNAMRRVLALAIITAVAVLMLGGALAFFERKPPGNDVVAIRDFRSDGRSIRIWGARTFSTDPEWKYLNVRRLFLFLEESIDRVIAD